MKFEDEVKEFFLEIKEYKDLYIDGKIQKSYLNQMYKLHNKKLPPQLNTKCDSCIQTVYYNLKNLYEKHYAS